MAPFKGIFDGAYIQHQWAHRHNTIAPPPTHKKHTHIFLVMDACVLPTNTPPNKENEDLQPFPFLSIQYCPQIKIAQGQSLITADKRLGRIYPLHRAITKGKNRDTEPPPCDLQVECGIGYGNHGWKVTNNFFVYHILRECIPPSPVQTNRNPTFRYKVGGSDEDEGKSQAEQTNEKLFLL